MPHYTELFADASIPCVSSQVDDELKLGDILAHVVVRVGENLIESVITRKSAEEMKLRVGDTVAAVIKSTEVMLQKD